MADKYVPIFFDWIEATQELKAQEKGRLIDAIVEYARGGDWSELLEGNERYVFPIFRLQIDRARNISGVRSEARKNKTDQTEQNRTNGTNTNKTDQNRTNPNKTPNNNKYKNKDENKYKNNHDDDARAREDDLPWVDDVSVYAANNLQHMSPGNLDELAGFMEILPDDLIRFAIDEACKNGAPRWAYASAILQNYVRDGIRTVGDAMAAKDRRKASGKPAQNYAQHNDGTYENYQFTDLSEYGG